MFVAVFIGIVIMGCLVMGVTVYNGLVRLRNQVERAWANIDVILKQRYDEIPQLVQVIEQYSQYEASLIQSLTEARTRYGQVQAVSDKISASQDISAAFRGLFALSENYPELKSNENFKQLQSRISSLEESLADRRETYNETVANFNTRLEQVPDLFFAQLLKYERQTHYPITQSEKAVPSLKMNLPNVQKGA